jgi:hypothetical protein
VVVGGLGDKVSRDVAAGPAAVGQLDLWTFNEIKFIKIVNF